MMYGQANIKRNCSLTFVSSKAGSLPQVLSHVSVRKRFFLVFHLCTCSCKLFIKQNYGFVYFVKINWININDNFCHCTVHSDIHAVHSPTDAHLLKLLLQITLKLDVSYMFPSTTIIRERAIESG